MRYHDGPCDPHWTQFSASLRQGQLYVKMPVSSGTALVTHLEIASVVSESDVVQPLINFLRGELDRRTNPSLYYAVSVTEAEQDIEAVRAVEASLSEPRFVTAFRKSLEAGLRNDPSVDWITRVGGPMSDELQGSTIDPDDLLELPDIEPILH